MSMTPEELEAWNEQQKDEMYEDPGPREICGTCAFCGDLIAANTSTKRRYCCVRNVELGDSFEVEEVGLEETCDLWKWEMDL